VNQLEISSVDLVARGLDNSLLFGLTITWWPKIMCYHRPGSSEPLFCHMTLESTHQHKAAYSLWSNLPIALSWLVMITITYLVDML